MFAFKTMKLNEIIEKKHSSFRIGNITWPCVELGYCLSEAHYIIYDYIKKLIGNYMKIWSYNEIMVCAFITIMTMIILKD